MYGSDIDNVGDISLVTWETNSPGQSTLHTGACDDFTSVARY